MKPLVTLYLLADDVDYRLLRTADQGLSEIPHTSAELTDAGVTQVLGHTAKEVIERGDLAKHAARVLAREWSKGDYDRIVISAGPKMLGALRDAMPKALHGHIATELHKDLMNVAAHDLNGHLVPGIPSV